MCRTVASTGVLTKHREALAGDKWVISRGVRHQGAGVVTGGSGAEARQRHAGGGGPRGAVTVTALGAAAWNRSLPGMLVCSDSAG